MTLRNHRPRTLRRELTRFLLRRRAKRVKVERIFQDLDAFLAQIREVQDSTPPWQRRKWADDE